MTRLGQLDARVTFRDDKLVGIDLFYPEPSKGPKLSFEDVVNDQQVNVPRAAAYLTKCGRLPLNVFLALQARVLDGDRQHFWHSS